MTDKTETKAWRYYCNRPGGYGCQPDGFTNRDSDIPKREHDVPQELPRWGKTIYSFGWVEYPDRLKFDKIYGFELIPADLAEHIAYRVWREHTYYSNPVKALDETRVIVIDIATTPDGIANQYDLDFKPFLTKDIIGQIIEILSEEKEYELSKL